MELLVGLAIASILVGSIYYVSTVSTKAYRTQEMTMRAMEQARFALEILKRDISAAGFLASPNTDADPRVCLRPIPRRLGLVIEGLGDVHEPTVNKNIAPSAITLFGAYPSPNVYYTASINGNVVTLLKESNYPKSLAEFNEIFNDRRLLRIVNKSQNELYIPITKADYNAGTIILSQPVPISQGALDCGVDPMGAEYEVNVVSSIRYSLRRDIREGAPPGKIDLIREELDNQGNPIVNSRLIIAEYVVDLQFYDAVRDRDITKQNPDLVVYPIIEDGVAKSLSPPQEFYLDNSLNARPQDLRFITIKVTTRTSEEDETVVFRPREGLHAPLDYYDVDTTLEGAARTATLTAKVQLKAFSVKNVKGVSGL